MTASSIEVDHSESFLQSKALYVKPLEWSEPKEPDDYCLYSYVTSKTPFGIFRITWKSWKNSPCYDLDMFIWDEEDNTCWIHEYSLEKAKQATEKEYQRRIIQCLANSKGTLN